MRIFLDSNIFLRYFVPEQTSMYDECESILRGIENGIHQPYTSAIVVLECSYVLGKLYKFSFKLVADAIGRMLSLRNLTIIEITDTRKAFAIHQATLMKLSDCLIATQVPKGVTLVTYDRDFIKLPGVTVKTPRDIVSMSEKS